MDASLRRCGLATLFAVFYVGIVALPAIASATEYKRSPQYSLLGNCETNALDPIPDPSCPYSPPPAGPSGRFNEPRSIAIDAYGNEYVASYANGTSAGRIDVFNDEGKFITELADPNGPKSLAVDSEGNLYVWEKLVGKPSEIVRYAPTVYEGKAENIKFNKESRTVISVVENNDNGGVAVGLGDDHLFIADGDEIREYNSAADGNGLLGTISGSRVNRTNWVAVDAKRGRLYASFCKNQQFECVILVRELAGPHSELKEIDGSEVPNNKFLSVNGWLSIAVDELTGHFFVDDLGETKNIYEFDENFKYVSTLTESAFVGGNALQIALSNSPLDSASKNRRYLFVPIQSSSGRAFAFEPVEKFACSLEGATAANVAETEAELSATVNSKGAECQYSFEVGETGSGNPQVIASGNLAADAQPTPVSAIASGLKPNTQYTFRAFAENEIGSDEEEVNFFTYTDAPVSSSCPNQALRSGPSAKLPDCRAYELVTPADTNGHPPRGMGFTGDFFSALQVSPAGEAVSFRIEGGPLPGFAGTGSFDGDPYVTTRSSSGWNTSAAGVDGTQTNAIHPGSPSADQHFNFWQAGEKGPAVVEPGDNRYVRYPDGHSELIGTGSEGTDPKARGMYISEGGDHIVFRTINIGSLQARPLEPNAPAEGTTAVYDRIINPETGERETRVVSLLLDNSTPAPNQDATYVGTSRDGEGIAFQIANTLFLRLHNEESFEVGTNVKFAGVSEGGERVFYVQGGNLKALDTATEEVINFTETGDAIPVNVSNDGSRAYFVSEEEIASAGANPNGDLPIAGGENLYLSEEGNSYKFVGTVTGRDLNGDKSPGGFLFDGLGLWIEGLEQNQPSRDPSRLNPDGSVMLFQSRANLDEYDPGEAPQVYRYDSAANSLRCISCLPSRTAAAGGASLQSYTFSLATPIPFSASGFVPGITPNGNRAFFQSIEPLVANDTDGLQDVYEWEAQGVGSCTRAQGCVYLISSGSSGRDSYLYGHSTNGDDVFFTTTDVLLASDTGGTLSIYDARVNGGFAESTSELCQGEGCKPGLSSPPPVGLPPDRDVGDNNVTEPKPKKPKHCPKGKRKVKQGGKVKCVKKAKKHQGKKQGRKSRGAGR